MNLHDQYGEEECNGFEWNILPSEVIKRIIKHRAIMEQEQDIINENLSSFYACFILLTIFSPSSVKYTFPSLTLNQFIFS